MRYRQAAVFMNEHRAGTLRQEPGRYVFEYDSTYLAAPGQPAISLTLPKTQRVYISPTLFPFFAGLLTEGTNHSIQVRAFQLDENDAFGLLLATAQQQTIGAVTVREILP
jgi:HipA-like protein